MMVEQLSPSSKTLTIYHTVLTGLSTHCEARDKAKIIPLFSFSLPTMCHDFARVTMLKGISHGPHFVAPLNSKENKTAPFAFI